MKVGIYTPAGPLYEGEAKRIAAQGAEGAFEVLDGHAPMAAQLAPGELHLTTPEGEKTFPLQGGFLWIEDKNQVRILGA
jgi:F-type H+-transporting ATPase subunit epsilon